jgi:glycosyltransferase involved in cell wall biosynthesis
VDVSIVIPAYNEAIRIADTLTACEKLMATSAHRLELVVVDDGSTDDTAAILSRFAAGRPGVRILTNPRNLGKGAAVRRGMLDARGAYALFMDADLSVPIEELPRAIDTMVRGGHRILIGSRRAPGAHIARRQSVLRESMGHVFTYLARVVLTFEILDFTCGFKAFERETAQMIFSLQRRADWAFDAEILYLARLLGVPVYQHPVVWLHRDHSRVRFPRDAWRSFTGLLDVRMQTPRAVRRHTTGLRAALPPVVRTTR